MLEKNKENNPEWRQGIRPYWQGKICPHFSHPIWEVLVHGSITIWGTSIREAAYKTVKDHSPQSVSLLEISRLAATLGSDLGHSSAFVVSEQGKFVMKFCVDMRGANDPNYLGNLHTYINENPRLVNLHDIAVGGSAFALPNFAMYPYVFEV